MPRLATHYVEGLWHLLDEFSDEERRTLVLGLVYEQHRKDSGQWGYWLFQSMDAGRLRQDGNFKTLNTIRAWMESEGLWVTLEEPAWQRYVQFAFDYFGQFGQRPIPCQLKSRMLLRRFKRGDYVYEAKPTRSWEQVRELYRNLLHREVVAG